MELVYIIIILVVSIIALIKGKKDAQEEKDALTKEEQIEMVKDLLNREYEKENAIPDEELLISRSTFEDMCRLLKDAHGTIKNICREREFQNYILGIKSGNATIDSSQKLFESMKFFIIQDILRNFSGMGHRYYTSGGAKKKYCRICKEGNQHAVQLCHTEKEA